MKEKIKIFIIALVIGIISSYIFYYKTDNSIIVNAIDSKATIFYVGAYSNLKDAESKSNTTINSVIYKDNDIYKIIIAEYTKKEIVELMTSYFDNLGIAFSTSNIKIDSNILKIIRNYELLIPTSDQSYYNEINKSIISLLDKNN